MTKYYLRLLLLVAAIVVVLVAIEALMPRGYSFRQSVKISAPPEEVFPVINSLKKWPDWSKQFNIGEIEGLRIKYGGNEAGVGAVQTWSEIRGDGKLWISKSIENEKLIYESEFATFPKMTGVFTLEKSDDGTLLSLEHNGRLPRTPLYGVMNLSGVFTAQMQHEYGKSLEGLKELFADRK